MIRPDALLLALQVASAAPAEATSLEAWREVAVANDLAESRQWHLLMHYRPTWFGVESEADAASFFLSADGKTDPAAELDAFLAALAQQSETLPHNEALHCRFPARVQWLGEHMDLSTVPMPPCPDLDKWLRVMDPGGVSLIFASSYVASPASMFGHTLLRVDKRQHPDKPLLSNIINYAATPTTNNAILYALGGLLGAFRGHFAAMPYYVKVQEYNNFDSRDLWEYQLDLSEAEIHRMLLHTWELQQTFFFYYYLSENCSFHLLSLIEVARPDLRLTDQFPLVAMPTDTVRAVANAPGLVRQRHFRPSHTTQMAARIDELSDDELVLSKQLATAAEFDPTPLKSLASDRQVRVLDVAHDYLKFDGGFFLEAETGAQKLAAKRELQILRSRSQHRVKSPAAAITEPVPPEQGHPTSRLALGALRLDDQSWIGALSLRTSLHDLLDPQASYVANSAIKLSEFDFLLDSDYLDSDRPWEAMVVDRFSLAEVTALRPFGRWLRQHSWRLRFGWDRLQRQGCVRWRCTGASIVGGWGIAAAPAGWMTLYSLAEFDGHIAPALEQRVRTGLRASAGLLVGFGDVLRIQTEAGYRWGLRNLGDPPSLRVEGAANLSLGNAFGMRATGTLDNDFTEVKLVAQYYYY